MVQIEWCSLVLRTRRDLLNGERFGRAVDSKDLTDWPDYLERTIAKRYQTPDRPLNLLPRRRMLSSEVLASDPSDSVVIHNQHQSGLMTMLPPEIRVQIYEQVLSRFYFRLIVDVKGVWAAHFHDRPMGHDWGQRPCSHVPEVCKEAMKVLSLLLTCRTIYIETVQILYSKNLFQLEGAWTQLPKLLLPRSLNDISTVLLSLEAPISEDNGAFLEGDWQHTWRSLYEFRGLTKLVVGVHEPGGEGNQAAIDENLRSILPPVLRFAHSLEENNRPMKSFSLYLAVTTDDYTPECCYRSGPSRIYFVRRIGFETDEESDD